LDAANVTSGIFTLALKI